MKMTYSEAFMLAEEICKQPSTYADLTEDGGWIVRVTEKDTGRHYLVFDADDWQQKLAKRQTMKAWMRASCARFKRQEAIR